MSICKQFRSSLGRKYVMAASGLALFLFLLVHLAGNLTLFAGGRGELFNSYAHHLESLGPLLYAMEAGLLAIFLFHVISAFAVHSAAKRARPQAYAEASSKGGPSRLTTASKSMIYTGIVLLLFIPAHIWMFKYNYGTPHAVTELHGQDVKDLYGAVVKAFAQPAIAWGYAAVMLLLGFHLRHGFWSALQSLGAMRPSLIPLIYGLGLVFALLVAGGFLVLPLYLHYAVAPLAAGGGL